jgi:CheY-like chemotaxis protein
VDDDKDFLSDLDIMLRRNYEVYCAHNSSEAFYLFKKQHPDYCIIDVQLPPLIGDKLAYEGLELARRLLRCNPAFDKFIFMSNNSFPDEFPDFRNHEFLTKPFMIGTLLGILQDFH